MRPTERILFVDDEENVLNGIRRRLRKRFDLETAVGPIRGLEALENQGPFAIAVSDMQMPGLSGAEFLHRVEDRWPDTVRIMLTGDTDRQTAVDAVNEGHIFRFLSKPCATEDLIQALESGLQQHRFRFMEKELLEKTLRGSVKVLTDVLGLVNPAAFGRATRARKLVGRIAELVGLGDSWEVEVAAMLSQIGCVTVPEATLAKVFRCEAVTSSEARMLENQARVGHDLLVSLPRLQGVAEAVLYQGKHFDGRGFPDDDRHGPEIPLPARILKVALDYDALDHARDGTGALRELRARAGWYDPAILCALESAIGPDILGESRSLSLSELKHGMVLAQDAYTSTGLLLVTRGHDVTASLLTRLNNFADSVGIREPIHVCESAPTAS